MRLLIGLYRFLGAVAKATILAQRTAVFVAVAEVVQSVLELADAFAFLAVLDDLTRCSLCPGLRRTASGVGNRNILLLGPEILRTLQLAAAVFQLIVHMLRIVIGAIRTTSTHRADRLTGGHLLALFD